MAEWSQTYITIKGKEYILQKIEKKIEKFAIDDYKTYLDFKSDDAIKMLKKEFSDMGAENFDFNDFQINEMELKNDALIIDGEGRWGAPNEFFELFGKKYKLDVDYLDYCNGCDYTYYFRMKNGEFVDKRRDEYHSSLTIEKVYDGNISEYLQANEYYFDTDSFNEKVIEKINKAIENYKKNNIGVYAIIQKGENELYLRYFLVAQVDNNNLPENGYIYAYAGGGEYEEAVITNGKITDNYEKVGDNYANEFLNFDFVKDNFEYVKDGGYWRVKENSDVYNDEAINDSLNKNQNVTIMHNNVEPVTFGLSIFENELEWKKDNNDEIEQKRKKKTQPSLGANLLR